jgi:hypoxanthine-guanine phosphoribosyltransferase
MRDLSDEIQEVLFTEDQLRARVAEVGAQITADYQGKAPLLVSVLRGSYIFMADPVPVH